MIPAAKVVQHYGESDLRDRLRAALTAAGLGGWVVVAADLGPLDQFHRRGIAATAELGEAAGVTKGSRVLDIGSGLGGPSRYLAATFDCHVTGIDLSPSFVEAASYLAARAGVAAIVIYEPARAGALPYGEQSFDVAWTQHVAMNITDRPSLYREAYRVLRRGGGVPLATAWRGNGGGAAFPAPLPAAPPHAHYVKPPAGASSAMINGPRAAARC